MNIYYKRYLEDFENKTRAFHKSINQYLTDNGFSSSGGDVNDRDRNIMIPLIYKKFEVEIFIQNHYYSIKNIVTGLQYLGDLVTIDLDEFKKRLYDVTKLEDGEHDE